MHKKKGVASNPCEKESRGSISELYRKTVMANKGREGLEATRKRFFNKWEE